MNHRGIKLLMVKLFGKWYWWDLSKDGTLKLVRAEWRDD